MQLRRYPQRLRAVHALCRPALRFSVFLCCAEALAAATKGALFLLQSGLRYRRAQAVRLRY